jgi:uncharacterized protein YcfL
MRLIILLSSSLYLFVGCGSDQERETIAIASCVEPMEIETYTPLQENDTIVEDSNTSTINLYYGEDLTKTICVEGGSAKIHRIVE